MKYLFPALLMALAGLLVCCLGPDTEALKMAQKQRDTLAAHGGSWLVRAEGLSNWPLVKPGDMLIVRAKPFAEVAEGDLVAFVPYGNPEIFVTHFAEVRRWDGWITKGVNNPRSDANRVNAGNYVGVAEVVRLN